jgi:ABC-type antimicrobial peptide transport system permease subunit
MRTGTTGWLTTLGVSASVRHWGPEQPFDPEIYVPFLQQPFPFATFVVRAAGDPLVSRARLVTTILLGSVAVIALAVAIVGINGVMTQVMAMRTSEIALRMTLGATPEACSPR